MNGLFMCISWYVCMHWVECIYAGVCTVLKRAVGWVYIPGSIKVVKKTFGWVYVCRSCKKDVGLSVHIQYMQSTYGSEEDGGVECIYAGYAQ